MENNFAKYNYKEWFKRNEDNLIKQYDFALKNSKEDLKEDFKYFEIDFNFFSFMVWKSMLNLKDGEMFLPYMQINGKFDLSKKMNDFINEFATQIVDISDNDKKELRNVLCISNRKEFYKTFYFIYASMLGVENYYFDKMFKSISESKFYKSLSEKQKMDLEKVMKKLNKTKPETKSNEDLIKSYFKIAFKINEIPVLDQLNSEVYSKTSWSRKLKDLNFLVMINKECDKRLNKKLRTENKNLVIKIKNNILHLISKIQTSDKFQTGITNKNKPDFKEDYFNIQDD